MPSITALVMIPENRIYRQLQRRLDTHPVGFPSTWTGADIRFLKRVFTPDEARLAARLEPKPLPREAIIARAAPEFSAEQTAHLLESMTTKGAIGWREIDGRSHWFLMPMVVGIYEFRAGDLTPAFLADADAYMRTPAFGASLLAASPSQMRTIPINKSISAEHHVATYDQIRDLAGDSPGPFVVVPCICRQRMALKEKPCKQTKRIDTCLAFGDMASHALRCSKGRQVQRGEVLAILQQNEDDGLVVQPSNTQRAEFVCSCCGCCCGMLSMQKSLPHPVDFWTSNFYAEVDADVCSHCGKCVSRCQVGAITRRDRHHSAIVNLSRCIGCGLCVTTCPSDALRLCKKAAEVAPPTTLDDLNARIGATRRTAWQRCTMLAKVALGMRQ
jgi:Na+-translocating ferredoxin:NAD+ oxidoreductase subunit B